MQPGIRTGHPFRNSQRAPVRQSHKQAGAVRQGTTGDQLHLRADMRMETGTGSSAVPAGCGHYDAASTGSGKTFIACALAHQACRQKRPVPCRRVSEPVSARARDKGTHERLMRRLAKVSLLVLDDWGLQGFSAEGRRDLLEIAEQRCGRKSILIASRIPTDRWPRAIGEPTIADAVLDRIVHNAYRIELKGESQRKRNRPPPLNSGG